jgi:hypothetical protein
MFTEDQVSGDEEMFTAEKQEEREKAEDKTFSPQSTQTRKNLKIEFKLCALCGE